MSPDLIADGVATSGGARWFDLRDRVSGAVRRVFLWLPPGETPEAGWPALTMTDGNAVIGTAVDAMRAQASYPLGTNVGWGVLIAVGYPTDDAYDPVRRSWDLAPPPGRSYPPFWPGTPEVRTGGGAEMARFILEDLRELLAGQVRLDPSRQGLFGHSFGGLFALWLMFTRPDAFTHWIAASADLTWEDGFMRAHRDAFDPGGRALSVHLSAGEWEGEQPPPFQQPPPADRPLRRTLGSTRETAAELARLPGLSVQCEIYSGENHMSVLPVAVNRAVQTTFALR